MEIKRCYETIIGASVGENQLLDKDAFSTAGGTSSISGDVITITPSGSNNRYQQQIGVIKDHVYYQVATLKSDGTHTVSFLNYQFLSVNASTTSATWTEISGIGKASGSGTSYIQTYSQDSTEYHIKYGSFMLIDLTQMLGSSIADYIYSLESATAGAGIAKLKEWGFLTDEYIPHNAGTLESVEARSHVMRGFNQWDEVAEVGTIVPSTGQNASATNKIRSKNYIPVIPSAVYHLHVGSTSSGTDYVYFYDADKTFVGSNFSSHGASWDWNFTVPDNAYYMRFIVKNTAYNHDICINLSNPDRNGEYEPYHEYSYPLDSTVTLRGIPKLDASNNLYYDGDTYAADGTVTRKYGIVDLGTLTWYLDGSFYSVISDAKPRFGGVCSRYPRVDASVGEQADKTWQNVSGAGVAIWIKDTSYSTVAEFKTAMSGVMFVYELATPTTETADPFTNPQICDPDGTEEYVTSNGIPVGHETRYQL